jgi:predicted amidophosphoribosyltransferase
VRGADATTPWWASFADLILPTSCAGCGVEGAGQLCTDCGSALGSALPRWVAPDPRPPGLPPCVAVGPYQGALRSLLLAYKERGAYALSRPLGDAMAAGVAAAVGEPGRPVALVGVPSTKSAVRERYGDHVARLGRRAAATLRSAGRPVIFAERVVRALPKEDSSHLSAAGRAVAAASAFALRRAGANRLLSAYSSGAAIVIIDDIVTTGATLAALSGALESTGVRVHSGVTLAATQRWGRPAVNSNYTRLREIRP